MAVTNNIREIREQRGIYQDDLAAAIGFSTKTVGRIERRDSTPSAEFMLRISKYFNLLVEDVFHVEDWAGYFIQLNLPLPVNENLSAPLYKIIPFRSIDIFENAVSAGTGNFLVDRPKETVCIDESILPEDTTFGVRISGDSMEPEFHDGQIAWVLQQESVANGEIGIFALNGEAYIKKLQVLFIGHIILHNWQ